MFGHQILRPVRVQLLASIACDIEWDDVRYVAKVFNVDYPSREAYRQEYLHKFVEHYERTEPMTKEDIIELAAKTAHTVNNEYRKALGEAVKPAWEECPEELRNSVRSGVSGILAGNSPETSHEGWLTFKAQHGWSYGEVEDPIKKTHPCFLPYDQLPPAQRLKDTIFHSVVRGVLLKHGLLR